MANLGRTNPELLGTAGTIAGTLAGQGSKYAPLYGVAGRFGGNVLSNLLGKQNLEAAVTRAAPNTLGAVGGALGQILGGKKYGPYAGAAGTYLGNVGKSLLGGRTLTQSLGGNLAGGVTGLLGSVLGRKNPALSYIGGQLGSYIPAAIEQALPSLASNLGLQGATSSLAKAIAPASVLSFGAGQADMGGYGGYLTGISPLLGFAGSMINKLTGFDRKESRKLKAAEDAIYKQVVAPITQTGQARVASTGLQFNPTAWLQKSGAGGPLTEPEYQAAYNKGLQVAQQAQQTGLIPVWEDLGGAAGSLETTPNRVHMIPGSDQELPGGTRAPVLARPYLAYLLTPGEYEMYKQVGYSPEPGGGLDPTLARMRDMLWREQQTGQRLLTDEQRAKFDTENWTHKNLGRPRPEGTYTPGSPYETRAAYDWLMQNYGGA